MKSYLEAWEKVLGMSLRRAKRIFIAATHQNVGKTTVSLGLVSSLNEKIGKVGFIKPVGQRYMMEDGQKVDEDSILMDRIFNFGVSIKDMSPIAVERGYTERFIDGLISQDAVREIKEAFERVASQKDIVIVEGTGHAGVGSVFDLSNAAVAKMLESKVILISAGGIGRAIDEVMLNKSLFDRMGVPLAGVVINKVMPHKYDKINKFTRRGLERLGVPVLGVIPYSETLDAPSVRDIKEELDMHVICGGNFLDRHVKKILVGAMEVKDAEQYLVDDCLVITPGDRMDLIGLIIKVHTGRFRPPKKIAGIILSGGISPSRRIYGALKEASIPTLVCRFNTYDVAAKVHDLTVKIKSRDENKIKLVEEMIGKYVDIEAVIRNLQ